MSLATISFFKVTNTCQQVLMIHYQYIFDTATGYVKHIYIEYLEFYHRTRISVCTVFS